MNSRVFKEMEDYKRISSFLGKMHKQVSEAAYLHYGDIVHRMNLISNGFDIKRDIRIWEEDEAIVAFAIYTSVDANPEFQIEPKYYDVIGSEMVDWAVNRATQLGHGCIETSCIDHDTIKADFLVKQGFELFDDPFVFMVCDIEDTSWQYTLPQGYEIASRVDYNDLTWGNYKLNDMGIKLVRDDLDLRVIYNKEVIAVGSTCWYDEQNNVAEFEPVEANPAHRRKGLTYSVMARTMEKLKGYGVKKVIVKTSKSNTPAIKLYEKLGFRVRNDDLGYLLKIDK